MPVLGFLFFSSSLSGSLIRLLLVYPLALKTPPSWLPVAPTMAPKRSVITDGEEMSEVLQSQPFQDLQFKTNKPKHQQKSEAIFQMQLMPTVTACLQELVTSVSH